MHKKDILFVDIAFCLIVFHVTTLVAVKLISAPADAVGGLVLLLFFWSWPLVAAYLAVRGYLKN